MFLFTMVVQVWRVNDSKKNLLSASEQSKFYSGDCYIFQYSYPGEDKEEHLIGTWFGKQSIEVTIYQFCILAVTNFFGYFQGIFY